MPYPAAGLLQDMQQRDFSSAKHGAPAARLVFMLLIEVV
jgi:hypothetical protein